MGFWRRLGGEGRVKERQVNIVSTGVGVWISTLVWVEATTERGSIHVTAHAVSVARARVPVALTVLARAKMGEAGFFEGFRFCRLPSN